MTAPSIAKDFPHYFINVFRVGVRQQLNCRNAIFLRFIYLIYENFD